MPSPKQKAALEAILSVRRAARAIDDIVDSACSPLGITGYAVQHPPHIEQSIRRRAFAFADRCPAHRTARGRHTRN